MDIKEFMTQDDLGCPVVYFHQSMVMINDGRTDVEKKTKSWVLKSLEKACRYGRQIVSIRLRNDSSIVECTKFQRT
jgi:hypothetical protein